MKDATPIIIVLVLAFVVIFLFNQGAFDGGRRPHDGVIIIPNSERPWWDKPWNPFAPHLRPHRRDV